MRRANDGREFQEEIIFRKGHSQPVNPKDIEKQVSEALQKLLQQSSPTEDD